MKTALITGAMGQDGQYLTEHLLGLGYRVVGMIRRQGTTGITGAEYIYGDVRDEASVRCAIRKAWPDEIYNLAGQVYVPLSWEMPEHTFDVNVGGLSRILKVVEQVKNDTRVYQASSSEMFGNHEGACDDKTPLAPTSPYGISKAAAHRMVSIYRDRGLYVVAGLLFNHESPRRGPEMVTRKIVCVVARWAFGSNELLHLGNLDSRRDWGFSGEYVKAMHLMLQQDKPDDYVVGTGQSHSVAEFLAMSCKYAGISEEFCKERLRTDQRMVRNQEIYDMRANNEKAKSVFGWTPTVGFEDLVSLMVHAELEKNRTLVKAESIMEEESVT
jgi:GDPmannose 4,6-dehydratase